VRRRHVDRRIREPLSDLSLKQARASKESQGVCLRTEAIMLVLADSSGAWITILTTVVAPAVVGVVVWIVLKTNKGPKKELAELARQMGLGYDPTADNAFRDDWAVLPEIKKAGRVRHLLSGPANGFELTIFEHQRFTMAGNTPTILTYAVYATAATGFPDLHVKPRGWSSRQQLKKGKGKGVLIGDKVFDEKREVECKDADFVRWLLTLEMRALMAEDPKATWHVVGQQLCLVYNAGVSADSIRKSIDRLKRFWAAAPRLPLPQPKPARA
jgi:hypothetical protein